MACNNVGYSSGKKQELLFFPLFFNNSIKNKWLKHFKNYGSNNSTKLHDTDSIEKKII